MNPTAKTMEATLEREEARHEKRLRTALNAMPVPLTWARLSDGAIQFMNRKFTETYGYRVGDFATVQEWVDATYPVKEQRDRAERAWYAFFEHPTDEEFEIDPVEVDVLCADGSVKTALHGGVIVPEAGWALATFVDITERKRNEALIRHMAEEDPLTGLANRRVFEAQLDRLLADAERDESTAHVLMVDLDHFKEVNDTLGHEAGDRLLCEFGARLERCVRRSDIVARLGGDEFGIILPSSGADTDIDRICAAITDGAAHLDTLKGQPVAVGVNIGIAVYPTDANDAQSVLRAADRMLYKAKAEGRGTWRYASRHGAPAPGAEPPA